MRKNIGNNKTILHKFFCICTVWAGKADWSAGGAAPKRMGKQPKAPLSPQDAYALYLQSLVSLPSAGKDTAETAEVSEDDLTVLKVSTHRAQPCAIRGRILSAVCLACNTEASGVQELAR